MEKNRIKKKRKSPGFKLYEKDKETGKYSLFTGEWSED